MSAQGKSIWLARTQNGFAQRQARQRFLAGMRIAEEGVREGARMERNWQMVVAHIPFRRRVWIALLIVCGKWGTWKGSGSAEPAPVQVPGKVPHGA